MREVNQLDDAVNERVAERDERDQEAVSDSDDEDLSNLLVPHCALLGAKKYRVILVERSAFDLAAAHPGQGGVAVVVEAPLAQRAIEILGGENGIADGDSIGLARALDGVQHRLRRVVAVGGV